MMWWVVPTVVGCVDGTLINIDAPVENEEQFVDRHGAHSINCMACVGPDRQFFNVSACWPGSVHDARVLRRSNMCADFEEGWRPYPNGIILGDSAYPLKPWLLTPLFRNLEDNAVRRYNKAHKSTRSIVENAFGILKEKFPILNHMRVEPRYAGEIFKCCTVLCNLSKRLEDLPPYVPQGEGRGEEEEEEVEEEYEDFEKVPVKKRRRVPKHKSQYKSIDKDNKIKIPAEKDKKHEDNGKCSCGKPGYEEVSQQSVSMKKGCKGEKFPSFEKPFILSLKVFIIL
uniref:Nuclease HARBI1 n=2 Tax=Cacopsylla melanoneura TaxID=428564 RepID=A0A8D9BCX6_9HEMI